MGNGATRVDYTKAEKERERAQESGLKRERGERETETMAIQGGDDEMDVSFLSVPFFFPSFPLTGCVCPSFRFPSPLLVPLPASHR